MTPRLICFGSDPVLLHTRKLILEQSYRDVAIVGTAAEFAQLLEATHYDVVILCHSLNAEQRHGACELVSKQAAGTKILGLLAYAQPRGLTGCDHEMTVLGPPQDLLRAIEEMLQPGASENPPSAQPSGSSKGSEMRKVVPLRPS